MYRILMQQTSSVQPLSCDEAFMDVTGLGDPDEIASKLRAQIKAETGCTASAGIGPNMLLARLATKRAKPNGQFHINPVQVGILSSLIYFLSLSLFVFPLHFVSV